MSSSSFDWTTNRSQSTRSRPELKVDMRLLMPSIDKVDEGDDEYQAPIQISKSSIKARRNYAVLEDGDDTDDDDNSATRQYEFILPECDSSSSESDQEVHASKLNDYSDYDYDNDEMDPFEAAFVAPSISRHVDYKNRDQQSISQIRSNNYSSVHPLPISTGQATAVDVVDLCEDSDTEDVMLIRPSSLISTATRQGVRVPFQSPQFNAQSRTAKLPPPNQPHTEDEIIDCWSSPEQANPIQPRRITDIHEPHKRNIHDEVQACISSRSRIKANQQNFMKQSQSLGRRRRLREANGSIGLRNSSFVQASDTVWYRNNDQNTNNSDAASLVATRNDLSGGSGVGAGSYELYHSDDEAQSIETPSVKPTRKRAQGKRKAASATKKKRGWGGGRKNYYQKKGQSKATSSDRRRTASTTEYARQDPHLQHVGGAKIIF